MSSRDPDGRDCRVASLLAAELAFLACLIGAAILIRFH